ncbi:hypothetical protein OY671_012601, partial [Metschnikowia pulcherrima]
MTAHFSRRRFSGQGLAIGAGGIVAATALDRIWSESDPELSQKILDAGEDLNIGIERSSLPKLPRAPEFPESAISRHFPSSGGYGATY